MLVTAPFGVSSNIALWRAYSKPPVELVVADLGRNPISKNASCVYKCIFAYFLWNDTTIFQEQHLLEK